MRIFVSATLEQFAERVEFDATVAAFTVGASLLAGLIAGVGPALLSTGRNLVDPLREGGWGAVSSGSGRTVRRGLVVLEMKSGLTFGEHYTTTK